MARPAHGDADANDKALKYGNTNATIFFHDTAQALPGAARLNAQSIGEDGEGSLCQSRAVGRREI